MSDSKNACTHDEFHEWLSGCPAPFEVLNDDYGECAVHFTYEEEDEEGEED